MNQIDDLLFSHFAERAEYGNINKILLVPGDWDLFLKV